MLTFTGFSKCEYCFFIKNLEIIKYLFTFVHVCSYDQIMNPYKKNLVYKIAIAYYENSLSQQQIAEKFGLSRIMISRLLQKALHEKIVEIKIYPPENPNVELERKLEEMYGLKEAIVVGFSSANYEEILEALGKAGVNYLQRNLKGNETISISWGKTLLSLVNALPSENYKGFEIIQMIGGLGYPEDELSGTELTSRMANILNARARLLNSPGIVSSEVLCNALKSESHILATLNLAKKAKIALVGIGNFSEGSILFKTDRILTSEDIAFLKKNNTVGDISLRFFNKEGKFIKGAINDRVVGLTIEEIKSIPYVVGIAGGKEKVCAIHAALKGKFINVLITDNSTAKKIITKNS